MNIENSDTEQEDEVKETTTQTQNDEEMSDEEFEKEKARLEQEAAALVNMKETVTNSTLETQASQEQTEEQTASTVLQKEFGNKAVMDIRIKLSVTLGKSKLRVHQMLKLGRGAVLGLDQKLEDPVEVYADNILIAHGNVVVTPDDKIGVSITSLVKAQ